MSDERLHGKYNQPWLPWQTETALAMRAEGFSFTEIGERVGRSERSTRDRLKYLRLSEDAKQKIRQRANERHQRKMMGCLSIARCFGDEPFRTIEIPDYVIAEREMRHMALMSRSITAWICGDPAPGWSALDRRRS